MPIHIENRKDDGAMVSTLAVDFTYDGNGTRAKKALSNGDTTYYIDDHFEVVNGEETKYIFAGNQRVAKVTTADNYFYHKDHLGSSSVMTDYPAGATVETTEYLPFGHEREHTGAVVTDYKFTDQEKDTETGLYNYDARMYDPVIARFITPDPFVPDVAGPGKKYLFDPQMLNRYTYVRNNPLNVIDPSGLFGFGLAGGGSINLLFYRASFDIEARFIHDSNKPLTEGWEFGFTVTGSQTTPSEVIEHDAFLGGLEADVGSKILMTNANSFDELLGESRTIFGASGGWGPGANFEHTEMIDKNGRPTGVEEISYGQVPMPGLNFGIEAHAGTKNETKEVEIFRQPSNESEENENNSRNRDENN